MVELDCTPEVRHGASVGFAVRCIFLDERWLRLHDERQLTKRKRALLESTSPRNSQLETHRNDGPGEALWRLLPTSTSG